MAPALQEYRRKLEEILRSTDDSLSEQKWDAMQILKYLMPDYEVFATVWKVWEKGVKEIKDQEQFSHFVQPFISYITDADIEYKKSVKQRLYELMQASDPQVRKRALVMHGYFFK